MTGLPAMMSRADHKVSYPDQEMQFAIDDDAIDQLFSTGDEKENPPEDNWLAHLADQYEEEEVGPPIVEELAKVVDKMLKTRL